MANQPNPKVMVAYRQADHALIDVEHFLGDLQKSIKTARGLVDALERKPTDLKMLHELVRQSKDLMTPLSKQLESAIERLYKSSLNYNTVAAVPDVH